MLLYISEVHSFLLLSNTLWFQHNLDTHSLFDIHLGYFQFLASCEQSCYESPEDDVFSFLTSKYLGEELLTKKVGTTAKSFPIVCHFVIELQELI